MNIKIAVTSSYAVFTTLCAQVSKELAAPVIIIEAVLEEARCHRSASLHIKHDWNQIF